MILKPVGQKLAQSVHQLRFLTLGHRSYLSWEQPQGLFLARAYTRSAARIAGTSSAALFRRLAAA